VSNSTRNNETYFHADHYSFKFKPEKISSNFENIVGENRNVSKYPKKKLKKNPVFERRQCNYLWGISQAPLQRDHIKK